MIYKSGLDVCVLVDIQNMYHTSKQYMGKNISYEKLLDRIMGDRNLIRSIAYIVDRPDVDQEKFISSIFKLGFDIRRKDIISRKDGSSKADWDVGITIDAVQLVDKCDTIALVTGDGDFEPLVHYLKSRGIKVELYSFKKFTSQALVKACDYYDYLDEAVAEEKDNHPTDYLDI
jgi:uncharacterized LabA/DUF88 family protein